MSKENEEIIAGILAAGIMSGSRHVEGHVVKDPEKAVEIYHNCLTALRRRISSAWGSR